VKITPALLALLLLGACTNAQRLAELGRGPQLAPVEMPEQTPVTMPMPPVIPPQTEGNSLWRGGSRTFLRDQRAAQVGDVITVLVQIDDRAKLDNSTERSRENSENMGLPHLLGLESRYARLLTRGIDPANLIDGSSSTRSRGQGAVERTETVTLRIAATVVQSLPNGNMVVTGRQQVRVNSELRDLTVTGILRPQDIASDNTVRHDRLAEARIAYGGRGTVSDVQTPRYGQQLLDIILPF
jgi:flagellar L-ring protein precursor FlgH